MKDGQSRGVYSAVNLIGIHGGELVTVSDSCVQREVQLGKAIKNGVVFLVLLCLWIL